MCPGRRCGACHDPFKCPKDLIIPETLPKMATGARSRKQSEGGLICRTVPWRSKGRSSGLTVSIGARRAVSFNAAKRHHAAVRPAGACGLLGGSCRIKLRNWTDDAHRGLIGGRRSLPSRPAVDRGCVERTAGAEATRLGPVRDLRRKPRSLTPLASTGRAAEVHDVASHWQRRRNLAPRPKFLTP